MLGTVVVALYTGLLGVLSVLALHRLSLALAHRGYCGRIDRLVSGSLRFVASPSVGPPSVGPPSVLVQLPLYNESCVAQRVIDAACSLEYPADRLHVQVLDDSNDGSEAQVAAVVRRWAACGVNVMHLWRPRREGFKAGALAAGLRMSSADLVAMFDADFVPPRDFLQRLIPAFQDPRVGMVQARWGHLNRHDALLTEAQGALLDAHFVHEHGGRFARGLFFNFNGTCGIWRRAAILDAGGWSSRTLTEDLDLSYRAQLLGWRFVYRPDVVVPGELPAGVRAFKAQQYRWAKGSIETARWLLPKIWGARLSMRQRVEATVHLGGNMAYPLVLLLALLVPFAHMTDNAIISPVVALLDALLLLLSTVALLAFYGLALHRSGAPRRSLMFLPVAMSLGAALAINNTRAVFSAFAGRRESFVRTPKVGTSGPKDVGLRPAGSGHGVFSRGLSFEVSGCGVQPWVELSMGLYMVMAALSLLREGRAAALPFVFLWVGGFLWFGLGTLARSSGGEVCGRGGTCKNVDSTKVDDENLYGNGGRCSASSG